MTITTPSPQTAAQTSQSGGSDVPESMRAVIERAGEEAMAAALRRDFPFDADWSQWIPDSAWPAPRVPRSWERLACRRFVARPQRTSGSRETMRPRTPTLVNTIASVRMTRRRCGGSPMRA